MARIMLAIVAVALVASVDTARGQDNPQLREFLGKTVKNNLAKHNSEETAWYSEKGPEKKRAEITGKRGRTITVEWTQESKTWLWLDEPDKNLNINVSKFELKDGMLSFGLTANGKAKGKAWAKISDIIDADVKTSANVEVKIEAKAKPVGGKLTEVEITSLTGKLSDLKFEPERRKAVQTLLEESANEFIRSKNDDFKKAIKKAIEDWRPTRSD